MWGFDTQISEWGFEPVCNIPETLSRMEFILHM